MPKNTVKDLIQIKESSQDSFGVVGTDMFASQPLREANVSASFAT